MRLVSTVEQSIFIIFFHVFVGATLCSRPWFVVYELHRSLRIRNDGWPRRATPTTCPTGVD